VTKPSRPTFLRRKLGAKLRRLREDAGHTLEAAAPMLDKTRSALQRIESGETRPDVHLVRSMMDLYDIYDPCLLDEVREALKPPWYRTYGKQNLGYVDVETEAAQVIQFMLIDVPGLLQTESYMRALFSTAPGRTQRELDDVVAVRLIRQLRLTDEDRPLELVAIVHEIALRREIGGPEVMREQLMHLVEMSRLPTVTLHVVPLSEGRHWIPNGEIDLLGFPDPEDQELLYVEHPAGSLHIEDPQKVQEAKLMFEQLRTDALTPADSVALIERLIT
jgi:transcriptional regulator with XRE-family HTH domain